MFFYNLPFFKKGKCCRISSYDRTGGNKDYCVVKPGKVHIMGEIKGEGCITHLWFTFSSPDNMYLRKILLRFYWDEQQTPCVLAPVGDFFCLGHGKVRRFSNIAFAVLTAPERSFNNIIRKAGFNCYFPMPFKKYARLELLNETEDDLIVFYNHDYVLGPVNADECGRFHANFRRDPFLKPVIGKGKMKGKNITGKNNYVILDTKGKGHYVGCNLSIDYRPNFHPCHEGDEMIFVDGEPLPSIHGTGTEDYFGSAWSWPCGEYSTPFVGVTIEGMNNFELSAGQWTFYRLHIPDPIIFSKSIKVTIEHGNANECEGDYASTAYWYQSLPSPVLDIPDVETRAFIKFNPW